MTARVLATAKHTHAHTCRVASHRHLHSYTSVCIEMCWAEHRWIERIVYFLFSYSFRFQIHIVCTFFSGIFVLCTAQRRWWTFAFFYTKTGMETIAHSPVQRPENSSATTTFTITCVICTHSHTLSLQGISHVPTLVRARWWWWWR